MSGAKLGLLRQSLPSPASVQLRLRWPEAHGHHLGGGCRLGAAFGVPRQGATPAGLVDLAVSIPIVPCYVALAAGERGSFAEPATSMAACLLLQFPFYFVCRIGTTPVSSCSRCQVSGLPAPASCSLSHPGASQQWRFSACSSASGLIHAHRPLIAPAN